MPVWVGAPFFNPLSPPSCVTFVVAVAVNDRVCASFLRRVPSITPRHPSLALRFFFLAVRARPSSPTPPSVAFRGGGFVYQIEEKEFSSPLSFSLQQSCYHDPNIIRVDAVSPAGGRKSMFDPAGEREALSSSPTFRARSRSNKKNPRSHTNHQAILI